MHDCSVNGGRGLCCRNLDKQDFTVFLQRYCLLSDTKLSEIADDMIAKLSQPDRPADSAATSEDAMQQQMQAVSTHQVHFFCTSLQTNLAAGSSQADAMLKQPQEQARCFSAH